MTTTITTVEAREKFSDLVNQVEHEKERIILTRRGAQVAAIVPLEDLQLLERSSDKVDLQEAISALKDAREHGTTTLEQLQEEVG